MKIPRLYPRLLIGPLVLMAATALQCCDMDSDDTETEFADIGNTKQGLVEYTFFSGHTREGGVLLSWGTRSESDCAGFNLFRRATGEVDFVTINETLIAAKSPEGANYEYLDEPLAVGSYDFQMEEVDNQGNVTPHGGSFTVAVFGTGTGNGGDTGDGNTEDGNTEDSAETEDDTADRGFDCGIVIAPRNKNRGNSLLRLITMVF